MFLTLRGGSSKRYYSAVHTRVKKPCQNLMAISLFSKVFHEFFLSLSLGMTHMWCFD